MILVDANVLLRLIQIGRKTGRDSYYDLAKRLADVSTGTASSYHDCRAEARVTALP